MINISSEHKKKTKKKTAPEGPNAANDAGWLLLGIVRRSVFRGVRINSLRPQFFILIITPPHTLSRGN